MKASEVTTVLLVFPATLDGTIQCMLDQGVAVCGGDWDEGLTQAPCQVDGQREDCSRDKHAPLDPLISRLVGQQRHDQRGDARDDAGNDADPHALVLVAAGPPSNEDEAKNIDCL